MACAATQDREWLDQLAAQRIQAELCPTRN
jgi:hypothetical protein